jgi:hypothetical protein
MARTLEQKTCRGKRLLVKGGKLDRVYQITVPEDLDGIR